MTQIITDPRSAESETAEMLRLMRDIHAQNSRLLERLDKLEREQGRRAAVVGFSRQIRRVNRGA